MNDLPPNRAVYNPNEVLDEDWVKTVIEQKGTEKAGDAIQNAALMMLIIEEKTQQLDNLENLS